jgi:hypothetical protein
MKPSSEYEDFDRARRAKNQPSASSPAIAGEDQKLKGQPLTRRQLPRAKVTERHRSCGDSMYCTPKVGYGSSMRSGSDPTVLKS